MLGLVLAALLTSIAPSAAAETVDLGLADLGQRPTLTLDIPPAETVITIPVPDGLRPAELTGTLEVTGDPDPGLVEVRDGTRRLAVVDLRGQRGMDLPVTVPLADATVSDRAVVLTVTRTGTTQCDDGLLADRTTLRDLVVRYRGSEAAPDTVADFLPPVLAGLDLYLTDSASLEVKAAAVSLANAVAARYTPAAPPIRLRPLSAAGVSPMTGPLRRAIVLTGAGEGSLRLAADGRVLEITGAGDALAAQVSGLTSDLGRIALASRAVASRPQVRTELARTTQNLTELGLGSPTALGRGQATLTLGIDAVLFGTPAADWRARVVGTVATGAPPSASGHRGTVTLTANGQAVASWPIPLRFAISAIPLAVVLAGVHRTRHGYLQSRRAGPAARLLGYIGRPIRLRENSTRIGLIVSLLPAFLLGYWSMSLPRYAPQEYPVVALLTPRLMDPGTRLVAERQARSFATERELARYLDSLDLPEGAVVTDTVSSFAVVAASERPRQFVIPSDGDFLRILNDPASSSASYLLTVPNTERGTTDAVNRRFPTVYADGGGVGALALEIPSSGLNQPTYRLYRVLRRPLLPR